MSLGNYDKKINWIVCLITAMAIITLLPSRNVTYSVSQNPSYNPLYDEITNYKLFLLNELVKNNLTGRDFLIMREIAFCESSWRQFDENGEVVESNGNYGLFQINDFAHADTLKKLGMDCNDPYDNMRYAVRLYKANGVRDWKPWSGKCFIKRLSNIGIII